MTYDWRDDFSKSWELWRSTMRARHLQGLAPQGAQEARHGQSSLEDVDSLALTALSDGRGPLGGGA